MNNLLISTITFVSLALFGVKAYGKSYPEKKHNSEIISVSKEIVLAKALNENSISLTETSDNASTVEIDYIVNENGKAYVTYVHSNDEAIKLQAIQFIENAPIYAPYELGKIYSLQLKLSK